MIGRASKAVIRQPLASGLSSKSGELAFKFGKLRAKFGKLDTKYGELALTFP